MSFPFDPRSLLQGQQQAKSQGAWNLPPQQLAQLQSHLQGQSASQFPLASSLPLLSLNQQMAIVDANRAHLIQLMIMQEQENQIKRQYHSLMMQQQPVQPKLDEYGSHATQTPQKLDVPRNISVESVPNVALELRNSSTVPMFHKQAPRAQPKAAKVAAAAKDGLARQQEGAIPLSQVKPKKKDSKWLSIYDRLREYKERHGDCIVPRGYAQDPRLASWVAEQRKQYKLLQDNKLSSITHDRIRLLEDLGFAWNAQEAAWSRHLSDLIKFKQQTGHCHVPLNHEDFPKLGLWVKEQRRHYTLLKEGKASHMTEARAAQLDAVGFCWDTHEATWLERFKELTKFKEKNGSCIVPTNNSENPKLGTWVHHQRRQYKKYKEGKPCHITEKRIRALESLDFVWFPRESKSSLDSLSRDSDTESEEEEEIESLDFRPRKRQRMEDGDV